MSAWTQSWVDNFAGKYFNHAEKQLQETIRYVFPE
jgi:hypothetical protein